MNFVVMSETQKSERIAHLGYLLRNAKVTLSSQVAEIQISGLTDDSRKVKPGDLFVAVCGHDIDAREFIPEALSLGARAIITSPGKKIEADIPIVLVDNLRLVVADIANRFYDHPSTKLKVAGVTGTNGKTTVIHLIASIFAHAGQKWGKIGTVGYDLGDRIIPSLNTTPGSIDLQKYLAVMAERKLAGCAMEASSHALSQGRCEGVRFASATFTNLTQDHLDYHGDMQSYFEAKAKLFEKVALSVINIDDQYGRILAGRIDSKPIAFGRCEDANFRYRCLKLDTHGSTLEFEFEGEKIVFDLPLPGQFNHQNAAAAATTSVGLGLSLEEAVEGLSLASPVCGRLQPVNMGQPFGVYIDYAHTPDALEKLLQSVRLFAPKNLRLVFGCGGDRDKKKRPIMGEIACRLADFVYVTSDNPRSENPAEIIREIVKGIPKKYKIIEDRSSAIKSALSEAGKQDIVVIAGKGHEDYQIVGSVKKYFSDFEVAKVALEKLGYGNND